jgi:hypothetical protein
MARKKSDLKNIPMNEDIAVFARCWLRYVASESQDDLALVVLAQRIIFEKAKVYYRGSRLVGLYTLVENLKKNPAGAKEFADFTFRSKPSRLAQVLPAYRDAGLIP